MLAWARVRACVCVCVCVCVYMSMCACLCVHVFDCWSVFVNIIKLACFWQTSFSLTHTYEYYQDENKTKNETLLVLTFILSNECWQIMVFSSTFQRAQSSSYLDTSGHFFCQNNTDLSLSLTLTGPRTLFNNWHLPAWSQQKNGRQNCYSRTVKQDPRSGSRVDVVVVVELPYGMSFMSARRSVEPVTQQPAAIQEELKNSFPTANTLSHKTPEPLGAWKRCHSEENLHDELKRSVKSYPICRGNLLSAHHGGAGRRYYGATWLTWNRSIESYPVYGSIRVHVIIINFAGRVDCRMHTEKKSLKWSAHQDRHCHKLPGTCITKQVAFFGFALHELHCPWEADHQGFMIEKDKLKSTADRFITMMRSMRSVREKEKKTNRKRVMGTLKVSCLKETHCMDQYWYRPYF